MAGTLRRDHRHVDTVGRLDLPESDVEAVREEDRVAPVEMGGDVLLVDVALLGVGQQHHDEVGLGRRLVDRHDPETRASALAFDDEPSRSPTRTSTPESFRFRAWAWPCDP